MSTTQLTIFDVCENTAPCRKSTSEIYDQKQRVFNRAMRLGELFAAKADPSTGGSGHLVNNWGNAASKAAWQRQWDRWYKVADVFKRLYDLAEHRRHGTHFCPLWCKYCIQPEED